MLRAGFVAVLLMPAAAPARADCESPPPCRAYWTSDAVVTASCVTAERPDGLAVFRVHDVVHGRTGSPILVSSRMTLRDEALYLLYLRDITRWAPGHHVPGVAGPGPLQRTWAIGECSASQPLRGVGGWELDYVLRDVRRKDGEGLVAVHVNAAPAAGAAAAGYPVPIRGAVVELRSGTRILQATTQASGIAELRAPVGRWILEVSVPGRARAVPRRILTIGYGACLQVRVRLPPD
jgi:hypothetical protein